MSKEKLSEDSFYNKLILKSTQRIRESDCINQTAAIIKDNKPVAETLRNICGILPQAWQYPDYAVCRIKFDGNEYTTPDFTETQWIQKSVFKTFDGKHGSVDIFYTKQLNADVEGLFSPEERNLLENLCTIISGYLNSVIAKETLRNTHRGVKELMTESDRIKTITGVESEEKLPVRYSSIDDMLKEIAQNMPKAWQYPEHAVGQIIYNDKEYLSKPIVSESKKKILKSAFETMDGISGSVAFIYLQDFPVELTRAYLESEQDLLKSLSNLIAGFLNIYISSGNSNLLDTEVSRLLEENIERRKELRCINQTTQILENNDDINSALEKICRILPASWMHPKHCVARITYGTFETRTSNFEITAWGQKKSFKTINDVKGTIDVFYTKDLPEKDEGPFLKEERSLLNNLAVLISGWLNTKISYIVPGEGGKKITDLLLERKERMKELACLNQTARIIRSGKSVDDTLQQVTHILPPAWQYPEFTVARIRFDDAEYFSPNFRITSWVQKQNFQTIDGKKGKIEIYYTKKFPTFDEGPFLKEERDLIINLANILAGYLNSLRGEAALMEKTYEEDLKRKYENAKESLVSKRKLLRNFLNKNNYDRDIFHDLMPFKVKEILLIANLYDAYSIEREGRFSDYILGDYYQLNLTSVPRITGVSSYEEAFENLYTKHFDLIIVMVGVDRKVPMEISRKIKHEFNYLPIFLLLNNNTDVAYFETQKQITGLFDNIFVWNGDSKIFFTMVKLLEDYVNVDNDTKVGYSRIILLVEDSAKYYSRYLPFLFRSVMEQTRRIIDDVSTMDELYKILRLRVRPKVLLATTYEEAIDIFDKFKDYILCLITDVKFQKNAKTDDNAGFDLVKYIKNEIKDLPTVIQSSDIKNKDKALDLNCTFINKNSETLVRDIRTFISYNLGFGDFIYKDINGNEVAVAANLQEFYENLKVIPVETLLYHSKRNHFSLWLTARGEIQIARMIAPKQIDDFETPKALRDYLIKVVEKQQFERNKGKIIEFDETQLRNESNIISLSPGALGGKGRGLAFVHTLIYNFDISRYMPHINIKAPHTFFIGTEEFEVFLESNNLHARIYKETDYRKIKKMFLEGKLTTELLQKLRRILREYTTPLAVRSSGLFEDSLMQPFAGIFETYILPNSSTDIETRLKSLTDAVKLVFASVFSEKSKGYVKAINYKIEEEKMAVIIQELVGRQYQNYYYPHISGVAQSYNYYSFGNMQPEDGFAVAALGLGMYVVEGENAYRFCPKYPTAVNYTTKDLFQNSQVHFYAVDLSKQNINLLEGEGAGLKKLDVDDAEMHGSLKHCASVYSPDNNTITPGLDKAGPRIIDFANILKYNYVPLSETLQAILDIVREALGTAVEIEFAVDLNKDENYKASLYILQIKPLIGNKTDYEIKPEEIDNNQLVIYTKNGMGNGLIDNIQDVVFVDKDLFDKKHTPEIADEIAQINKTFVAENKQYVLIGPGRWGTRDRWIGIPVNWSQISNAKLIIETSLEGYPLDGSAGSHFFHNVTSMNVGYFSLQHTDWETKLDWELLKNQELIQQTKHVKHVRFKKSLVIRMDGKKRIAAITRQK